jgi:molybdate transport system substrate-binding protein
MRQVLGTRLALALAAFAAGLAGCSNESAQVASSGEPVPLAVYAATSTRDVLQALEKDYERTHGVDLIFNFGSSGDLSNQIVAAAKADVFLSADDKEMDKVGAAHLVLAGTRRALLSNQLVVIEPADGASVFTAPFEASQIAKPEVKLLSLGNVETVPAGRYAKAWLEKVGVWCSVAERILPGVDVRAALAALESGGAQAGIVYRTDAARSKKVRVVHAVPMEEGPRISYPIAVLDGRPSKDEARAFAEFLASPEAGHAFEEAGFSFLPGIPPTPR